ncbi:MAG: UTP--glucose-1-phosphate uridylyltransferase, partial [Myxococcales bacterium]|nr:UTP--glucose-1-phosphate uridylyltransferase [Myxococcales bacterium]
MTDAFAPFAARMRALGQPELAIRTFATYYEQLRAGATGLLPEADIEPVTGLPDADTDLGDHHAAGQAALPHTVVIKLNGGLGTGMGMTRAKSLLPVKDGLSFLDLVARQLAALHNASGAHVPLLLMDSFRT